MPEELIVNRNNDAFRVPVSVGFDFERLTSSVLSGDVTITPSGNIVMTHKNKNVQEVKQEEVIKNAKFLFVANK